MFTLPARVLSIVCASALIFVGGLSQAGLASAAGAASSPTARVQGGTNAPHHTTPWFLQWRIVMPGAHKASASCGATAISERVALTAAHCVIAPDNKTQFPIGPHGSYLLVNPVERNVGTPIHVDRIVVHPNYQPAKIYAGFDLALLHTTTSLHTRTMKLNTDTNAPTHGQDLRIFGLGRLSAKGGSPKHLQVGKLQDMGTLSCGTWPQEKFNPTIQLCAGDPTGKVSGCKGDSGGPILGRVHGHTRLVGVVSFGPSGCGTAERPGVMTRVSSFIAWINESLST